MKEKDEEEVIDVIDEPEKMNRGENAASKRWGKVDLAELREQRQRLELLVSKFKAMETAIAAFQFEDEKIRIDGVTKFDRATIELQSYIENVSDGIKAHKHGETY